MIGLAAPSPSAQNDAAEDVVAQVEQRLEVVVGALAVLQPLEYTCTSQ